MATTVKVPVRDQQALITGLIRAYKSHLQLDTWLEGLFVEAFRVSTETARNILSERTTVKYNDEGEPYFDL